MLCFTIGLVGLHSAAASTSAATTFLSSSFGICLSNVLRTLINLFPHYWSLRTGHIMMIYLLFSCFCVNLNKSFLRRFCDRTILLQREAKSSGAREYTDCISAEGYDSLKGCPTCNTKQSDGETLVMLELWGMQSTPLLPSLPGRLWPRVIAPDRERGGGKEFRFGRGLWYINHCRLFNAKSGSIINWIYDF